jgi:hypothetical protein
MTANGDRTRGRSPGIWLRLEACSVRKPIGGSKRSTQQEWSDLFDRLLER